MTASRSSTATFFVERIRGTARGAAAECLFYAYDAGSLRHFVVETCRAWVQYGSEEAFIDDSHVLTRPARMRARDDLTAPVVNWHTLASLSALLQRHGFHPTAQPVSFAEFQLGMASEEFRPHHLMCRLPPEFDVDIQAADSPYSEDVTALRALAQKLRQVSTAAERRRAGLTR